MSDLAFVALISGGMVLAGSVCLGLFPVRAGRWLAGFPRNIWAGRILTAMAIGWVAVLVWTLQIAWLDPYRLLICCLSPVAFVIIIFFMDELLAARALGGIFLLAPVLILDAAFIYPSDTRWVMTVLAYLLAILGMVLVWSPYMFRKMTAPWVHKPHLCRMIGVVGSTVGFIIILLGCFVYR